MGYDDAMSSDNRHSASVASGLGACDSSGGTNIRRKRTWSQAMATGAPSIVSCSSATLDPAQSVADSDIARMSVPFDGAQSVVEPTASSSTISVSEPPMAGSDDVRQHAVAMDCDSPPAASACLRDTLEDEPGDDDPEESSEPLASSEMSDGAIGSTTSYGHFVVMAAANETVDDGDGASELDSSNSGAPADVVTNAETMPINKIGAPDYAVSCSVDTDVINAYREQDGDLTDNQSTGNRNPSSTPTNRSSDDDGAAGSIRLPTVAADSSEISSTNYQWPPCPWRMDSSQRRASQNLVPDHPECSVDRQRVSNYSPVVFLRHTNFLAMPASPSSDSCVDTSSSMAVSSGEISGIVRSNVADVGHGLFNESSVSSTALENAEFGGNSVGNGSGTVSSGSAISGNDATGSGWSEIVSSASDGRATHTRHAEPAGQSREASASGQSFVSTTQPSTSSSKKKVDRIARYFNLLTFYSIWNSLARL